jgi:predicted esterase
MTRVLPLLPALLVALSTTPHPLAAQEAGAPSVRERLELAYFALERSLRDHPATSPAEREALNRAFDRGTLRFFTGDAGTLLAVLDSVATARVGASARPALDSAGRATVAALRAEARSLRVEGGTAAYLLHLPAGRAPEGGWPVVVALHGAGGDERMFFGGYGAGAIRDLADRHGVAVVTPRAPLAPVAVMALVDSLASRHPLDRERIGLLGHSMGAAVAGGAAGVAPARVRGIVCVAGTCELPAAAATVPVRLEAGALDPIALPARVEALAERLRAAGHAVELRVHPHEGHTLIVAEVLPEAMAWLAERLRR